MRRISQVLIGGVVLGLALSACGAEPSGLDADRRAGGDDAPEPTPGATLGVTTAPSQLPVDPSESIAAMFGWPAESEVALAYCPQPEPEHLPAGLAAVEVYVCATETRAVAGEGTWSYAVVRRAVDGADLLAAYATADEQPTSGICTLELPNPRVVWIKTDVITAVRAPVDGCHKPQAAAIDAYDRLATEVVAEERLGQISSELADTSGCEMAWTDMFAYLDAYPGGLEPRTLDELPLAADRACTYVVEAGPSDDKSQGELVDAATITDAEASAIDAALASSVEDPTCELIGHTSFVVLWSDADDKVVSVALDGCAVQLDGSWWRGSDELRTLLVELLT